MIFFIIVLKTSLQFGFISDELLRIKYEITPSPLRSTTVSRSRMPFRAWFEYAGFAARFRALYVQSPLARLYHIKNQVSIIIQIILYFRQ